KLHANFRKKCRADFIVVLLLVETKSPHTQDAERPPKGPAENGARSLHRFFWSGDGGRPRSPIRSDPPRQIRAGGRPTRNWASWGTPQRGGDRRLLKARLSRQSCTI